MFFCRPVINVHESEPVTCSCLVTELLPSTPAERLFSAAHSVAAKLRDNFRICSLFFIAAITCSFSL